MRPTIAEQLLGVDRLLDELAADPELRPESAELLRAARKQLQRVAASSATTAKFLRWDNAAMCELLRGVAGLLPDEIAQFATEACGSGSAAIPAGAADDDDARNDRLRGLLTAAIEALPDDAAGDSARQTIVEHLRVRAAANPALHKQPLTPPPAGSDEQPTCEAIT